jgi:chromosome segregation ATPase
MSRLILLLPVLLGAISCGDAEADLQRAQDELQKAGQEVAEAVRQRMDSWREDLATLDVELAEWKEKAQAQAATASAESKQKLQETIDSLEAKRQQLSAKLLAAGRASGAAWDEIAAGFESGWAELKAGLQDAQDEIK